MTDKKKKKKKAKGPTYRIPPSSPWANAWKIAAIVGAVGLLGSALGMMSDPHRFAFSWLFGFMSVLAVALGGLFFTIVMHLMGSGWASSVRRTSEFLAAGLPVFVILWIPIGLSIDELYPWTEAEHAEHDYSTDEHRGHGHENHGHPPEHFEPGDGTGHEHGDGEGEQEREEGEQEREEGDEHGALTFGSSTAHAQEEPPVWDLRPNVLQEGEDEAEGEGEEGQDGGDEHATHHTPEHHLHETILEGKSWHLDRVFFFGRAGLYFLIWLLLAGFFFISSTRQDKERGLIGSKRMEKFAPPAIILFALSLTFAAFDWAMSMEPNWYSTIFGVQYFAVCCVIGHAVIILLCLGLMRAGHLGKAVHLEHFHDVGKLLFGWLVFWAYVSFSQFMLIWYAGIPEEATYYHLRYWGGGGFQNISILLFIAGFFIPFFMLISRNVKRRLPILAFACSWVIVMHLVQMYWQIMPYAEQTGLVATSLHLSWMDFTALFAVGGVYMAFVLWMMTRYPLVPIGDPRLQQAIDHEVV